MFSIAELFAYGLWLKHISSKRHFTSKSKQKSPVTNCFILVFLYSPLCFVGLQRAYLLAFNPHP